MRQALEKRLKYIFQKTVTGYYAVAFKVIRYDEELVMICIKVNILNS
jgi:hypothetical protein